MCDALDSTYWAVRMLKWYCQQGHHSTRNRCITSGKGNVMEWTLVVFYVQWRTFVLMMSLRFRWFLDTSRRANHVRDPIICWIAMRAVHGCSRCELCHVDKGVVVAYFLFLATKKSWLTLSKLAKIALLILQKRPDQRTLKCSSCCRCCFLRRNVRHDVCCCAAILKR